MAPLLEERKKLLHQVRSATARGDKETRNQLESDLKVTQKRAVDAVHLAKSRWYAHLCEKIHDMSMNP